MLLVILQMLPTPNHLVSSSRYYLLQQYLVTDSSTEVIMLIALHSNNLLTLHTQLLMGDPARTDIRHLTTFGISM